MTIIEAIRKIDTIKPNTYTQEEKVGWLSTVDGMIKRNVIDTHHSFFPIIFIGYNQETPVDTLLLVPPPYDDLYPLWLEAQIDYHNGEFTRYNNTIIKYNDVYRAYCNDYNRTHMPKGRRIRFF
jgi:hypothetical protein